METDYKAKIMELSDRKPFSSTSALVYEVLLNSIVSGDLPGGTLITQKELAEQFGLSRTPVRDAIMKLTKEGYIEKGENSGLMVYKFNPRDYNELLQFRFQIESLAVSLVCINGTEENIDVLKGTLDSLKKADIKKDRQAALKADEDFHHYIVNVSGNQYLIDVYNQYLRKICFYRNLLSEKQNWKSTYRYHEKIICDIMDRNQDEGIKHLQQHFSISKDLAFTRL